MEEFEEKDEGPPGWDKVFILKVEEAKRAGGSVPEREGALRGLEGRR